MWWFSRFRISRTTPWMVSGTSIGGFSGSVGGALGGEVSDDFLLPFLQCPTVLQQVASHERRDGHPSIRPQCEPGRPPRAGRTGQGNGTAGGRSKQLRVVPGPCVSGLAASLEPGTSRWRPGAVARERADELPAPMPEPGTRNSGAGISPCTGCRFADGGSQGPESCGFVPFRRPIRCQRPGCRAQCQARQAPVCPFARNFCRRPGNLAPRFPVPPSNRRRLVRVGPAVKPRAACAFPSVPAGR